MLPQQLEGEFKVSANWDQIQAKAPEHIPIFIHNAQDSKGNEIKNRVYAVFTNIDAATEIYNQLRAKKLVAFRNWIV